MATKVQVPVLLFVYVVLQVIGGHSEELYPNLRCYPGYKAEWYREEGMKLINDGCNEEGRKRKFEEDKYITYNSRRGCLMTSYHLILADPHVERGKVVYELHEIHIANAIAGVLLNPKWPGWERMEEGNANDEENKHFNFLLDVEVSVARDIIKTCSAKLEEVKTKPEEEWTALYDCIDDILVCKNMMPKK